MKKIVPIILVIALLSAPLLSACAPAGAGVADEELCWDDETGAELSYQQAVEIAQNSDCAAEGQLKETRVCNSNTGTWWIDLEMDAPGCNPACVVDVNTKMAEINYRCTGLIPPDEEDDVDETEENVDQMATESEKPRVISDASAAELAELVAGNSAFAFDLYQVLSGESNGNLFYSPYSISLALAMAYAGARGETEQQMADTLHYALPQERLHAAMNALEVALAGTSGDPEDPSFQLNIANAIWGQEGYEFLSAFLDTLAQNYGAGMRWVDFVNQTEAARRTINDWVSAETNEKIEDLIPQGVLDAATALVLTNAIYFDGKWVLPFDKNLTQDAPFTLLDNNSVNVPMMFQTEHLGYAEGDGYQVAELDYQDSDYSMLFILPADGRFEEFEQKLSAEWIQTLAQEVSPRQLRLWVPKFSFESKSSLADMLVQLGMPAAFENADFSGMTGDKELFISDVLHQAFVAVDEEGTEAAAATAVIMKRTGAILEEAAEMRLDHPFFFLIRDKETGTILFLGRVLNPVG